MKDTMEAELNDHWLPLLQKGKEYLKQLLNKENADLKTVMTVEFPEITTEVFNKMSNSEYKSSKIKKMITDTPYSSNFN